MSNEAIDAMEIQKPDRPTFLTVLCILTFVVSGYFFVQSLIGIFVNNSMDTTAFNEVIAELYESMEEMEGQEQAFMQKIIDGMQVTVNAVIENAVSLGIFEMLTSVLGILGAVLMFRLNKKGYYIYILAKIVGVIAPLAIIGVNVLTLSLYGFIAVIGILFIVLYGVNVKYMR
jgi:hypothetical protein